MSNKIVREENFNLIDFVYDFKGEPEKYFFEFMNEQGYLIFEDFYNSSKIVKTDYNSNETTGIFSGEKLASRVDSILSPINASFDTSFDLSFES